jgi:hypothetical protein
MKYRTRYPAKAELAKNSNIESMLITIVVFLCKKEVADIKTA